MVRISQEVFNMRKTPGYAAVLLLVLVILMGMDLPCSAASQTVDVAADGYNITISVNGNPVKFDQPPYINNGRTMVPVRFVSEALGAYVTWDSITGTVKITDDKIIELKIGSNEAIKDSYSITLDAPAEITGGRTMVPLRFVSEALGAQVSWNQGNRTITPNTAVEKKLLSDNFENGSSKWTLEEGWRIDTVDGNNVLKGNGHSWVRLKGNDWDNYSCEAKFNIISGYMHFSYRLSDSTDGLNRYCIGVGNNEIYLNRQRGNQFSELANAPLKLDNGWHKIDIKGYEGYIDIYIDDVLRIAYKDENYINSGSIGFETLDSSSCLVDDVEIAATNSSNLTDGKTSPVELKPGGNPSQNAADKVINSDLTTSGGQSAADEVISQDQTWSGEVHVNNTVQVLKGVTLTIKPGTIIKFRHYRGYKEPEKRCGLIINGTLKAIGTPDRQIVFTSDASDPINGDWHMLRLENGGSESIIKYAVVEFAQQGINLWNCSPTISHTVVRWNNWEGIYLESYCKALIENNLIYENGYNGIAMEQFNDATIRYNTIMRSGTHGIHVDASTANVDHNLLKENKASGLSVDDNGTLNASNNTIENNDGPDIAVGEGHNKVFAKGNLFRNNGGGINPSPKSEIENIPGGGAGSLVYGYKVPAGYELGYIPGDSLKDRYMYVYPDDETRQIVNKIGEGLGLTWSLAWDGQNIWTAALWGDVYKLDPNTGEIKTHWIYPGPQAWGMTFDGENLWINDFAEKKVYQMTLDGKVLSSFTIPDPTGGAKGITWDGNYLYILGWTSSKIYQVDKQGQLIGTIQIQEGIAVGGLTWDGNYFWAPGGKGIVKIDRQGKIVGAIYSASEGTWDLAWDGSYLWACQRTNENWHDAKIFKLKILSDKP